MMLMPRVATQQVTSEKDLKLSRDQFLSALKKERDLRIDLKAKLSGRNEYTDYKFITDEILEESLEMELLKMGIEMKDYYSSWKFYAENENLWQDFEDMVASMMK